MSLNLKNRQRIRAVDLKLLRQITRAVLEELLGDKPYELGLHLVAAAEMATVNETFLQHTGSTDVITFDYAAEANAFSTPSSEEPDAPFALHGEIFICIDDAITQAKAFKTTWQSELVRYVVHGILHLQGYDDLEPALRKRMKREENRLVLQLSQRFTLSKLQRPSKKAR